MNKKNTVVIRPGEEPERLKRYIDLLCADLNQVYRHKIIDPDRWQHERWDAAVVLLCKELGYESAEDFLSAYGYMVMSVPGVKLLNMAKAFDPAHATVNPVKQVNAGALVAEQPDSETAAEATDTEQPANETETDQPVIKIDGIGEAQPKSNHASEKEDWKDSTAESAAGRTVETGDTLTENQPQHALFGASQKSVFLQSASAWWKKFHNRLMVSTAPVIRRHAFHSSIVDENTQIGQGSGDESTEADASPMEQDPDAEKAAPVALVEETTSAEASVTENLNGDSPEGDVSAVSEKVTASDTEDTLQAEVAPESTTQAVDDEVTYPTIPLDESVVNTTKSSSENGSEYTGKHSRFTPTGDKDKDMQALLEEFQNAEASPEPVDTVYQKPDSNPRYAVRSDKKKERDYTAKELFEATFGGIELEDEDNPVNEVERVFGETESEDRTPLFLKKISSKVKSKKKQFAAVFAGILIMAILAVFLRVLLDRHEAKVAAEQAAAEAAAQNITYVSTGSFTVSVTLPSVYTEDSDLTQKEYNTLAEELGYNKMLLQADGSIIYIMSRERQYQMRSDVLTEVETFFAGIPNSSAYPEIVSVEPDSDYMNVKITLSGDVEPVHLATLNTDLAYYCGKYQRVNGSSLPTLVITVYSKTGDKLNTYKPTCP